MPMPTLSSVDAALLACELPPTAIIENASSVYAGGKRCLEYRAAGPDDAPVIVLLHGIGSSSAGYRAQFGGLADTFRIIAWNAPGYGASTPLTEAEPDVRHYVDALAALLAELRVQHIAGLVGSSWGSVIAIAFAASKPDIVGSLVLSAPNTARGELSGLAREAEFASLLRAGNANGAADRSAIADRLLTPDTPADVRRHVERLRDAVTAAGWKQAAHMLFSVHTSALIGSVQCPVAIIAGTLDKMAPLDRHARRLSDAAPSAELHVLEGFGHMLKLEAPSRFNDIVRSMARG
jgi:pimeloyl-ACP methyl ester carboxylesterase